MKTITIIDYGMGNIWSVKSAFEYLNYNVVLSSSPLEIEKAEMLVLPGVGSYKRAMLKLSRNRLDQAIQNVVMGKKRKILGICLGIQLMSISGTEDGFINGLGLIEASTDKFDLLKTDKLKIPHIGFNSVITPLNTNLYKGFDDIVDFYFVHSYCVNIEKLNGDLGICNYGYDFLASYEKDNIFATQFHPEKSQTNGLKLISNFLRC